MRVGSAESDSVDSQLELGLDHSFRRTGAERVNWQDLCCVVGIPLRFFVEMDFDASSIVL